MILISQHENYTTNSKEAIKAWQHKDSIKNNENACHKYFLTVKPIEFDKDNRHKWSKGLDTDTQMYIAQAYKQDNQYDSNDPVTSIGVDELKDLKKRAKVSKRQLKRSWEV